VRDETEQGDADVLHPAEWILFPDTKLQFLISAFSLAEQLNILFSNYNESNGKLRASGDLSSPGAESKPELQLSSAGHLQLSEFRSETTPEIHSVSTTLDSNQGPVSGYSLGLFQPNTGIMYLYRRVESIMSWLSCSTSIFARSLLALEITKYLSESPSWSAPHRRNIFPSDVSCMCCRLKRVFHQQNNNLFPWNF
jgi:hypothetical protein